MTLPNNGRCLAVSRRVLATTTRLLAGLLVAGCASLVAGTLVYRVPYLGFATAFVPPVAPRLALMSTLVALLAVCQWWRRRRRFTALLAVVALLTAVGASVITARMTAAVERAGARISVVDTLSLRPTASASPDAKETYGVFEGQPLELSIYRPTSASGGRVAPVLLYIFGGGWEAGSRDDRASDLRWFADRGWLAISVDYSLSSPERHLWDVNEGQLGCALAWVARHAMAYGGDPTRLSMIGASAGGNIAIDTAFRTNSHTLHSPCDVSNLTVAAVSAIYPIVDPAGFYRNDDPFLRDFSRHAATTYIGGSPEDFPARYNGVTPTVHLSAASPPTLILVGEADHVVPPEGTYEFATKARERHVKVELVRVPYADHRFDSLPGSIGAQAFRQLTANWLHSVG